MIKSVSLWHITPADLGVEFLNPTDTVLSADEKLYQLVNDASIVISKQDYSESDYKSIVCMRRFLSTVKARLGKDSFFFDQFPDITGCIAKYCVSKNLFCYIMVSGIAVFLERGVAIPIEDEDHFSLPVFYERQIYEDDYCKNPECTPLKKPLYDFLRLLWSCVVSREFHHSSTENFGNHGIQYTLCITAIDSPDLISNQISESMKRNIRALIDTSAFNNVLQKNQWELIKKRIDNDDISDLKLLELSENLVFADNWSGVLLAGDLANNETCINWFLEFEIFLQSQWLLFSAYCENIARMDMSAIELQGILNRVEFVKVKLDNDISSNMEQSRHIMRNSLIASSDINTIYYRMHGMVSNKLKMKVMRDEKKKSRFALFSDLSLLVIALLQIYGVVGDLLAKEVYTRNDFITMGVMLLITAVCIWVMVKGRK